MGANSRKWWIVGLGVLLVAVLLYRSRHIFNLSSFSGEKFWHAIKSADPLHLLAAVVLIYVCYFLRALRWQNFQKYVGNSRLVPILNLTIAGFAAVFLFGRVGEPVRPLLISRREEVPLADTFGIYALERFLDVVFSVSVLGTWFFIATIQKLLHPSSTSDVMEGARKTAGTVLTLGVIGLAVLIFYIRTHGASMLEKRMEALLAAQGWKTSVARIILGVARGLKTIRTWRDLAYALGVSTAHWFLIIVVYYLVAQGFGGKLATLPFQDSMLVLALTLVGSLFQLPGIGGGPQAVMIGAYTRLFGIPGETAVAIAMVLYLVTFAASLIVGVPLLLKEGLSLGELRRLRKEETEEIDAEIVVHPGEAVKSAESSK